MPALRELFAEYEISFDRRRNLERGSRAVDRLGRELTDLDDDASRATRALRRLSRVTGVSMESFQRIGRSIGTAGTALAGIGAAAGVGAAAGLGRIVSSTTEATRELTRLAGTLQTSEDNLRSWTELGREYGIEADRVAGALTELQAKAQDAISGGTEQAEMFERIGISVEDLRAVVNDSNATMELFTSRLDNVSDAGLRLFTVDELMSDEGKDMLRVFNLGSREISRRRAEITRTVGPMGNLTQAVAQHTQTVIRVTRQWEAFKSAVTVRVLPIVGRLLTALSEHGPALRRIFFAVGRLAAQIGTKLAPSFRSLTAALSDYERPIMDLIRTISRLLRETKLLEGAFFAVGAVAVAVAAATIGAWGPVALAMVGIVAAVVALTYAYDQVARTINGGTTALSEFLDRSELLGEGGTQAVVLLLRDAWDWVASSISGANDEAQGFMATIEFVLEALSSFYRAIEFVSGGFVADLFGGTVLQQLGETARQRQTAQRTARDEAATARGESAANRAIAAREASDTRRDPWTGAAFDVANLPLSVPRSAALAEARVPRRDRAQPQPISVDAPTTMNFTIAEATDAQEVTRLITREVSTAQSRWISEIESMISDQTEVGS